MVQDVESTARAHPARRTRRRVGPAQRVPRQHLRLREPAGARVGLVAAGTTSTTGRARSPHYDGIRSTVVSPTSRSVTTRSSSTTVRVSSDDRQLLGPISNIVVDNNRLAGGGSPCTPTTRQQQPDQWRAVHQQSYGQGGGLCLDRQAKPSTRATSTTPRVPPSTSVESRREVVRP